MRLRFMDSPSAMDGRTARRPERRTIKRTRDDDPRELVFTGEPGNYVTQTDGDGRFLVYRVMAAKADTGDAAGAMRGAIRGMNRRAVDFWRAR
ncbi:hypothetical protein [Jiella sp. M17.18]|uniref:hypothetical protein n=1 Tax=Jiella sp. M17.18 TaxID=3234247 RepID=UPI0034DEAAA5